MRKVRVRIPATTANLGPGFDTLGIALNLYNEVALEEISDGLVIEIEGEGGKSLPRDERSIVYKAAEKVFDLSKTEISGLRIELINRIPLARGLGSSAAAYLGGLVAANKLCDDKFSEEEIIKFAVEIEGHPDNVVPAFFGGFAISVSDGDKVRWIRGTIPKGIRFVIAIPDFEVETRISRDVLPHLVPHQDAVFNVQRVSLLIAALYQGRLDLLESAMQDRLHQPYRERLVGPLKEVFEGAMSAGARGVCLSGAGPSVVALCTEDEESIGEAMRRSFEEREIKCRSIVLKADQRGIQIRSYQKSSGR